MTPTLENWISIAGVAVVLIVGIGGWYFLRPRKNAAAKQKQVVKGGNAIQSGRDTKIGND